jgi:hypothetical protein
MKFKNKNGLEMVVQYHEPEGCTHLMGGDDTNPTWEEYLDVYNEEAKPYFDLIRKAIEELGWVGSTGEQKANDTYFVFSDGESITFSWRAWGDLMQAIVGKREGYMMYYM